MEEQSFSQMQETRLKKLINKWAPLTEGIYDPKMKADVSQLLENQSSRGTSLFEADSNTGNLPTSVFPSRIAFPAIVQTFPALAANQLVQTFALSEPRALVLYKRYVQGAGAPTPGALLPHSGSFSKTAESGLPARVRAKLEFESLAVEKFMLGMQWTHELEEDAASLGNIDIQAELVAMARDEIAAELDGLIITDLFNAAVSADTIGSNGSVSIRGGAGTVLFAFDNPASFASYETPKAHEEMLLNALIDLKTQIFQKSFRSANFIVGGAAEVAKLEKLQSFARKDANGSGSSIMIPGGAAGGSGALGTTSQPTGAPLVGTIMGMDVYISAVAPAGRLLMGVKQAGYIFGMYKPFELTNVWYDNTSDEWIRSIRTRAARKLVDGAYYGQLIFAS